MLPRNSFRGIPLRLGLFPCVVTQIPARTEAILAKKQGGILGFMPSSPELETPLLMVQGSYILAVDRIDRAD